MKKHTSFLLIAGLILALGVSACSISLAQDITPPPGYQAPVYEDTGVTTGTFPTDTPDLVAGQAIFEEKCLPCHGETGMGDGPSASGLPVPVAQIGNPEFANLATPQEWYTITMDGNLENYMPPFSGSLNDQDVWNVLAYVYSLGVDAESLAVGEQVYGHVCANCHGTGAGDAVAGATDHRDPEVMVQFSIADIEEKVATGNGNSDHIFGDIIPVDQQEDVAYYVRSLIFPYPEMAAEATPEPTAAPTEVGADETAPTEQVAEGTDEQPTTEATEQAVETAVATAAPTEAVDGELVAQITGVVTNGSGGELPEDLEVTLEVYENFELSYSEIATVSADGSYAFENVSINPDAIYLTMVELHDTFFPSNFFMGEMPEDNIIDLPITVYDVSNDASDLVVSRLHVFFQFLDENTVQVIHQVSISNLGNAVVLPAEDGDALLNFTLPEGATNLIFQTGSLGNPYLSTADGFADPSSVLPGESTYEGLFAYNLPYDGKLEWSLPMDMPTDIAVVFIQGESTKVDSDSLLPSGTETLDAEDIYQVYVTDSLNSGDVLDLTISGNPLDAGFLNGNVLSIALGVVGLALAGYGAWHFFRPAKEDGFGEIERGDSEALIEEIVALDEAYEAGEIEEVDYTAQREALKAELKNLLDEDEAA